MGQGGQVVIVNATTYPLQLQKDQTSSTQMNSWTFPETIAPGTSSGRIYIEFSQAILQDPRKDRGDATYMIADNVDNPNFQIQARCPEAFEFLVQLNFLSLTMANNQLGSTVALQQMDSDVGSHDWECAKIVIAGSPGQYIGTSPPTNWMQTMLPLLKSRTLRQICLPGSHDSGMSTVTDSTPASNSRNTQTQTLTIGQQLAAGVRYFDIRASLKGSTYGTAHFSNVPALFWQGSFGQTMDDIIQEINSFTANNAELIIFEVSHGKDFTGLKENNVNDLTANQYTGLMSLLQKVNNRCTTIQDLKTDASEITVGDFIGNGHASVLFVMRDANADLTDFAGQGFIKDSQLNVFNKYSNSDKLDVVIPDQITKLRQQRTSPDSPMFLAAWIRTLTSIGDNLGGDILGNTVGINKALFQELWNACTTSSYPNILQVDGVDSTVAALAIGINYMFGFNS